MKKEVTIHIGGYYAGNKPTVIRTLLGSCVSVCLYDKVTRTGGMNHILLPGKANLDKADSGARFGVNAMELLINEIIHRGGNRSRLTAKAFGGASLIGDIPWENTMGKKNVDFVIDFLRKESIRLINQDFGGRHSRSVYFHTDTGEVLMKRIKWIPGELFTKEENKLEQIRKEARRNSNITLFQPSDISRR